MDFTEALNVAVTDIERPPLPPIGHYIWKVSKPAVFDTISDGRFKTLDFPVQAVQGLSDVDQDELQKIGGPRGINLRVRFMFNEGPSDEDKVAAARSLFQLRNFLEKHLEIAAEGMMLKEAIDSAVGMQFVANIQYRPDKNNPEVLYAEIGRTAPLSAVA